MRVACLLLGLFVVAGLGCDDGLIEHLLRGRGEGDQAVAAPLPDAGTGGSISGAAGGGGQGPAPGVACGALSLSSTIVLAPAAGGQNYVRCQTLGPETGWRVTLSPAGDRLAARTGAGTVRLLATDSWTEIAQLGSPLGAIDAVAFSPDGATLATLSSEMGEVALWSAHDGAFERSFAGPPASGVDTSAAALAFSSDGGRLATSLGTEIDLGSGTTTSWLTGAPETVTLTSNPENLRFSVAGGSIPLLRFTAGNGRLFVETHYQVGNSPTSTRLELRDPSTVTGTVLYDFYSRGLLGYAFSPDGRTVARATTAEAGAQGFAAGLALFDATSGTQQAFDPSFAGTVIGFSRDGARLFVATGTTVSAVARPTCTPSVNSPCRRGSPSSAFRPPTSWSAPFQGRPPGGTRPRAPSSRRRAIRWPPRSGRRMAASAPAPAIRPRCFTSGGRPTTGSSAGRPPISPARRRWRRWGRPDRPPKIRARRPATGR